MLYQAHSIQQFETNHISNSIRTLFPQTKRRRNPFQQLNHVLMLYPSSRLRIKVCPFSDELVEMMESHDGHVPGEVIKVVYDNGNEEIHNKELGGDHESAEVYFREG